MSEQSTIWWINPSALDDLTIEESESGFVLSAPEGTECSIWLSFYNESDERREHFNTAFIEMLRQRINDLEELNGCP